MYIHVSEQISGSIAGGIAGGVAGVLVVVILMVLLIILITLAVKRTRRRHRTNTQVQGENNQYYNRMVLYSLHNNRLGLINHKMMKVLRLQYNFHTIPVL